MTLAWDPNTEPDLKGYRLHYGTRSRSYSVSVDVGNVTNYRLSLPSGGQTYFFALTAYNTSRLESDFSNEISYNSGPAGEPLPDDPGGDTFSFQPTEDAFLQGTTRFNDSTLKVDAGYRVSYLKFTVSGLSGAVQSATLRLQENGDIGNGTLRVLRGSHNNWTETTLAPANAPGENGQVGTFTGGVAAARIVNINVTPLVAGNGTYSVVLKHDAGGNDVWFGSGESTRKPQLIIATTGSGAVTYPLTVNNGTGSGSYAAGTTVNVAAANPPAGQVFDRWTGSTANVANVHAASTSIRMPSTATTLTATYKASSSGSTWTFEPTEDAYLQGTTRFNDNLLKVEAGNRVSYLKFTVSGLSGAVQSATLRLQENGDIGSGTLRVLRGSHNNWTETTLTRANAPGENGQVGTFTGGVAAAQFVNINVTPLVTGNGTYTVVLKHDAGGNDVWFGSGESTRKPQLIIATSGSGSATYPLTVNSGTGTGRYAAGTTVNIVAAAAPAGQVFDRWTGSTANVANVHAASTSIHMPSTATTLTATYKASSTGSTWTFEPIEDAYLQGTTRFNDNLLKVEAGKRVSYLKFTVSGLSGAVQSATLRLQENGDIGSGTLRVLRGSHNNWTETTLTPANAPGENGQVGTFTGGVAAAQVVNINVTPLVAGNGTYSVVLKHDAGGNDVWFGSGESTRKPQLIIATSGIGSALSEEGASLRMAWDPDAGAWRLVWAGSNWVLQETSDLEDTWTDVSPLAASPHPITMGTSTRFFRLRIADQQ